LQLEKRVRRALASGRKRENTEGRALLGADAVPESPASDILVENEQMAFLDTHLAEGREGKPNESAPKSPASVGGRHGQMMNQTTTTVVPAKNGGDHDPVVYSDKAEAGIALKESANVFERVGVAESDTFSRVPQTPSLEMVFRFEYANVEGHPAVRPTYRR
jgi:hypothetical protein